jgi:hypothetical protein
MVNVGVAAIVLVESVIMAVVLMAIMLVDKGRSKTVIVVGEAVRGTGAVTEGKSGGGGQYTQRVKEGEHARHPEPCCPGEPNEHQALLPTT